MFISRTPLRVSLLGGGTDFPSYYHEHGGLCLSTTIDKYVYVIVKRRHDDTIRVSHTQTEIVDNLVDLQHDLIREAMRLTGVTGGVEILTVADVSEHGSGLASSSAVTVGVLNALRAYKRGIPGQESWSQVNQHKRVLAEMAIQIECRILGETPGHQDQYAVAHGGFNTIRFGKGAIEIGNMSGPPGRWQDNLLLFAIPTGGERDSQRILSDQERRNVENLQTLEGMKQLARNAIAHMEDRQFDALGPTLDSAWLLKKSLSPHISSPVIDAMYEAARMAGATGGKVCGAGAGGYMLFYCPDRTHEFVREAMVPYGPELKFNFEWDGSVCKRLF